MCPYAAPASTLPHEEAPPSSQASRHQPPPSSPPPSSQQRIDGKAPRPSIRLPQSFTRPWYSQGGIYRAEAPSVVKAYFLFFLIMW